MSLRTRPCLRGQRWTLQRGNTIEELALETCVDLDLDLEVHICKVRFLLLIVCLMYGKISFTYCVFNVR